MSSAHPTTEARETRKATLTSKVAKGTRKRAEAVLQPPPPPATPTDTSPVALLAHYNAVCAWVQDDLHEHLHGDDIIDNNTHHIDEAWFALQVAPCDSIQAALAKLRMLQADDDAQGPCGDEVKRPVIDQVADFLAGLAPTAPSHAALLETLEAIRSAGPASQDNEAAYDYADRIGDVQAAILLTPPASAADAIAVLEQVCHGIEYGTLAVEDGPDHEATAVRNVMAMLRAYAVGPAPTPPTSSPIADLVAKYRASIHTFNSLDELADPAAKEVAWLALDDACDAVASASPRDFADLTALIGFFKMEEDDDPDGVTTYAGKRPVQHIHAAAQALVAMSQVTVPEAEQMAPLDQFEPQRLAAAE